MKKIQRPRQLRYYRRIAEKEHPCNGCHTHINPGEEYEAYVMVYGKKLWVSRFHSPHCPWDPEEDREIQEELERIRQEEKKSALHHRKIA